MSDCQSASTTRSIRGHVVSISTYVPHACQSSRWPLVVTMSQCVLLNSTNVFPQTQGHSLPTPPEDVPSKRRPPTPDPTPTKRPCLARPSRETDDSDTEGFTCIKSHAHRHTMLGLLQTSSRRPPSSSPRIICMHLFLVALMYIARCSLSVQSTFAPYIAVLCILA